MILNTMQEKYYKKLYRRARGKYSARSLQESYNWLESNYTGETRKAIRHQMDSPSWMTTVELMLRETLRAIIKKE